MEHVFGRPVDEVIGLRAADLFAPDDVAAIEAADEAVRGTGLPSAVEEYLPGLDSYAWTLVVRFPLPAADGSGTMIGGFDIDITPLKRAEKDVARAQQALFQADKLNALGAFAAGVAHELNNPLMILQGQAAMLAEEAATGPLAERAAMIERMAERCGRIAQSFLAVARRKPAQRVPLDLAATVGAALDMADFVLRNASVEVRRLLASGLPAVIGDPDLLTQVLLNLFFNAQQAMVPMPGRRVLTIETALAPEGNSVTLEVGDTGPGIRPEERARVFEPFFTTRAEAGGTGLGLSYSRSAIEMMGGRIDLIDSRAGARFRITLPVQGKALADQPPDGSNR